MPLVAMGCMMQRDCQQDTCPVGVATQNCKLRSCFAGKPEYVVNFMMFVAEEMREIMAQLGFRTVDEMVGHPEYLRQVEVPGNWKANEMDLSDMLATVTNEFGQAIPGAEGKHFLPSMAPDCQLDRALDATLFIPYTAEAREHLHPIRFRADIANVNRCVGTMLGSQVTRQHPEGLPEGSIDGGLRRLGRPELRRLPAAWHHAEHRGRCERLLRQGAFGRRPDGSPA